MQKLSAWLFLLIAVVWLLPLINLSIGVAGGWIAVVALAVIAIFEIVKAK